MKQIHHGAVGVLAGVLMLTGTVVAKSPSPQPVAPEQTAPPPAVVAGAASSAPVELTAQPGSQVDRLARQLMAKDLARARRSGDNPLVLVGTARLGDAHEGDVLFVQLQSADECGSAGCNTVSFLRKNGKWAKVLDTVTGPVRVSDTRHRGMRDIIVHDTSRMVWDGARYADTAPIPKLGLRPRSTS
jgi:hypothetical protein